MSQLLQPIPSCALISDVGTAKIWTLPLHEAGTISLYTCLGTSHPFYTSHSALGLGKVPQSTDLLVSDVSTGTTPVTSPFVHYEISPFK